MEYEARGWADADGYVCKRCVTDEALKKSISQDESSQFCCTFCELGPAAPLNTLLEAFMDAVTREYGHPNDEGVPYDGRDGGFQLATVLDRDELLEEFGDVFASAKLRDAVKEAIVDTQWVDKSWNRRPFDAALKDSWQEFCDAVKYKTRYVLWLRPDSSLDEELQRGVGEISPAQILETVGQLIDQVGILGSLPPGYKMWRAQIHREEEIPRTARRLGTAPRESSTQANRMSPAGIPMFYGSEDRNTAIREVAVRADANARVTVGQFETSRESAVIDFTRIPPIVSFFDPEWGDKREILTFLHHFCDRLSEPARSTYEQIDYVPTQILVEYILRIFRGEGAVQGIVYHSAATGKSSMVFDIPNERCVEQIRGWNEAGELRIGLVPGSVSNGSLADLTRNES